MSPGVELSLAHAELPDPRHIGGHAVDEDAPAAFFELDPRVAERHGDHRINLR
jgi:hypothetical protein